MPKWPTIKSIAKTGVQPTFFSTPGKLLVIDIVILLTFLIGATSIISEYVVKPISIILSILVAFCASLIIRKFIVLYGELKNVRVIDVQPGMILCTTHLLGGLIGEGGLVLSRLDVKDQSPQIEIVIAGRTEPLIFSPSATIQIFSPLDDLLPDSENPPAGLLHALKEYNIKLLNEEDKRIAKNLGLIKTFYYPRRETWSDSATSYSNALNYIESLNTQGLISNYTIFGDVQFIENRNIFYINGEEIDIDNAIRKISNLVKTDIEEYYLELIKNARIEQNPANLVDGFLGLGKDIIVGPLGSAFWSAISGI